MIDTRFARPGSGDIRDEWTIQGQSVAGAHTDGVQAGRTLGKTCEFDEETHLRRSADQRIFGHRRFVTAQKES